MATMEKRIFWFEELGKNSSDFVGKKCANLGEMSKIGMRVPYGFAISVKGYEEFMHATGAAQDIKNYLGTQKDKLKQVEVCRNASRVTREIVESRAMPEHLKEEIHSYYHELCKRAGSDNLAVAVRSSGTVSMPGQMDTYLNIIGEASVIEHIKKVWSSTYTTRAITYRLEQDMSVEWAPIGVAVMMLVDAKSAGVVLTVFPTTGDTTKVVIEGNLGLGESVVSGEITPDSFVLDKESLEIVSRRIAHKMGMVILEASGTLYDAIPAELRDKPCLDDEEIQEIAKVALSVEKHFGIPQDMEWVVDKTLPFPQNIFWVQARAARYSKVEEAGEIDYLIDLMVRIFK